MVKLRRLTARQLSALRKKLNRAGYYVYEYTEYQPAKIGNVTRLRAWVIAVSASEEPPPHWEDCPEFCRLAYYVNAEKNAQKFKKWAGDISRLYSEPLT